MMQMTQGGANTVPIEADGAGTQAKLNESMPVQLQGALDPYAWTEFAQKVNAQLAKEHADIQATTSKMAPLGKIGCCLFSLPFVTMIGGLITAGRPSFTLIPFAFAGAFVGFALIFISGIMTAKAVAAAEAESAPVFSNISQESRSRNPNVSLDVRSVQVVAGYRKNRPIYKTVRYVEYAVAGSAAGAGVGGVQQPGMMQPGMMPPGMMQPGMMQPGMMQPGMMPGMMQPGMMQMGANPLLGGPPGVQGAMDFNALQQQGVMQPGQFGMTQPSAPGYM